MIQRVRLLSLVQNVIIMMMSAGFVVCAGFRICLLYTSDLLFVFVDIIAADIGDMCESDSDAGAVFIAQSYFYIIFIIKSFIYIVIFMKKRRNLGNKIVFENLRII